MNGEDIVFQMILMGINARIVEYSLMTQFITVVFALSVEKP